MIMNESEKPARLGRKVLVVDDDPLCRDLLCKVLEEEGMLVETAEDGLAALRILLSGEAFDLVVTDIVMPRLDGIELAAEIGKMGICVKIVVVTGTEIRYVAGAEAVLPKPFNPTALMDAINGVLTPERGELLGLN